MDTDSNYMALSGDLLDRVKPTHREEFLKHYEHWMVVPYCNEHREAFRDSVRLGKRFVPTDCCNAISKWDGRTPGKFKEEFRGVGIVCLNSKSYICFKENVEEKDGVKLSSKGLSKRTNRLQPNDYKRVLRTKKPLSGVNTGFVRKNNKTLTYSQIKRGLTYFYAKRQVLEDGVSTSPLTV